PCNVSDTPSDDEADYWESLPRVPAVKGSAAGCIEGPITPKSDCEAPGQYCDYRFDDEGTHQVEQCLCSPSATKDGGTWHCSSAGQDGVDPCPEEKPADGADCFGFYGLECEFPWRIGCTCSADTKKWACVDPPGIPDDAPRPSLSNLDKPVAELTSAERETICTWSATMSGAGEGFPPIAAAPVDAQGFTTGTACIFGDPDICRAAAPLLSKAQCLANLELSSCEAPVELMVDCALSLHYTCTPADQACGKYLRQTGCAGTMLGAGNDLSSCHLKVQ
ncbi:MAG TPA: hypothetical protein VEQ58_07180, partial [Polyangiaceae bacterium]|nr:hypothetical protein [Polyangiaceae bacterium]